MLFTSPIFLFLFLPLFLLIYYVSPEKLKNVMLLIFSLLFYWWGENKIVLVMLFSAMVDFSCGILIAKGFRRFTLAISILVNLGLLGFFKYYNFAFENYVSALDFLGLSNSGLESAPNIVLPIGISFYTFQTMSYTIDVYRGNAKASRNFIDFATYVTMFPQLVAGPIVRYIDIQSQLRDKSLSLNNFSLGAGRFIVGLSKKMLIANPCGALADNVFLNNISDLSTGWAWIGILAYAFQIYYDFSGYSDMAIGLGKMLGFDFLENFNFPYVAKSVQEFWRRWHISLSTWFRDYLYISIGGNRQGSTRTYLNLTIVFVATGLWHGASWNFVVWGLFHGAFLVIERLGFSRLLHMVPNTIQRAYLILVVLVGWVFFRVENLEIAIDYILVLFIPQQGSEAVNSYLSFFHFTIESLIIFCIAMIGSSQTIVRKVENAIFGENPGIWNYGVVAGSLLTMLLICLFYIASESHNPFIYFRF